MTLKTWFDAHPLAEYDFEIENVRVIARLSGHYYNQGDSSTHWECYGLQFPDVKRSVDEEIPAHIQKKAWKRGHMVAVSLQKDMPPESFEVQSATERCVESLVR